MIDKRRLKAALALSGKSVEDAATFMGINASTLYRKISGRSEFTFSEIISFCKCVNAPDPAAIFFESTYVNAKDQDLAPNSIRPSTY